MCTQQINIYSTASQTLFEWRETSAAQLLVRLKNLEEEGSLPTAGTLGGVY
jgi:hypothetical protein